jgi:hypothetical protein
LTILIIDIIETLTYLSIFMFQVEIHKSERDVYAAIIDGKIAMKIGPGHFEPPSGSQNWSSAWEGRDYKIWEDAS